MKEKLKEKLIEICKNDTLPAEIDVVIRESYIPRIPCDWNGILVLAISQNLSVKNKEYVEYLEGLCYDKKINRLNLDENEIGVWPWDNGSLKLALESVYEHVSSERTAVSNAALWSQRIDNKYYKNPDKYVQQRSLKIWKLMLEVLKPEQVICSGDIAESIIDETGWAGKRIKWLHLGRLRWTRIGDLDHMEVLKRYPEVQKALEKGKFDATKKTTVLFACNSVSRTLDGDYTNTYRVK